MRHRRQRLEWRGHNWRDAGSQEPRGSKGLILPSLRRSTDLWHPNSSPAILILNFWPPELWENSFLCFEAKSVSKLLPLPQETDTVLGRGELEGWERSRPRTHRDVLCESSRDWTARGILLKPENIPTNSDRRRHSNLYPGHHQK